MRIMIATDQWSPDAVGGSARVATATAQHFALAGHDVQVVSPAVAGAPAVAQVGAVTLHRAIRRGGLPQSATDTFETWRWARRQKRPDVLISHQATTAVGLLLAQPGVPLLHVFHASAPLEERFLRKRLRPAGRLKGALLDPLLVALERKTIRGATTIAVLSRYSRDLLVGRHPAARERVVQVRGGLDFAEFASGDAARAASRYSLDINKPFLLTVRRLESRMGVEELLRATSILRERGVEVAVGVAGTGPIATQLEALAESLDLRADVTFFGRVPDGDLPDLYAAATLFVLPTVAYEGFGISTIEALAAGTPVVGTPVGATPEILEPLEPRLLAEGQAPEQLAAAIEAGLSLASPTLRERSREYARTTFAWEAAFAPWRAALERTIGV